MAAKRKPTEIAAATASVITEAKRKKNNVVGLADWVVARNQLLEAEKNFSKARRALAKKRQELPWTLVKDYELLSATGVKTNLASLVKPGGNLIVYHVMFGKDSKVGCKLCSFFCDGFNGALPHILPRANMVAVASAEPKKLANLAKTKGWSLPLFSAGESSFSRDMGVTFLPDQPKEGNYNFGRSWMWGNEAPGLTVFHKDSEGNLYRTYSTYAAGLGEMSVVFTLLDCLPEGRDEDGKGRNNMWWIKHKEKYANEATST